MKSDKKQEDSPQNSSLGEFTVLSPSQKREQESLQKEKAKKDAAEREKRRIAAAKRKAAEEKVQLEIQRIHKMKIWAIISFVVCAATYILVFSNLDNSTDSMLIVGAIIAISSLFAGLILLCVIDYKQKHWNERF